MHSDPRWSSPNSEKYHDTVEEKYTECTEQFCYFQPLMRFIIVVVVVVIIIIIIIIAIGTFHSPSNHWQKSSHLIWRYVTCSFEKRRRNILRIDHQDNVYKGENLWRYCARVIMVCFEGLAGNFTKTLVKTINIGIWFCNFLNAIFTS